MFDYSNGNHCNVFIAPNGILAQDSSWLAAVYPTWQAMVSGTSENQHDLPQRIAADPYQHSGTNTPNSKSA